MMISRHYKHFSNFHKSHEFSVFWSISLTRSDMAINDLMMCPKGVICEKIFTDGKSEWLFYHYTSGEGCLPMSQAVKKSKNKKTHVMLLTFVVIYLRQSGDVFAHFEVEVSAILKKGYK